MFLVNNLKIYITAESRISNPHMNRDNKLNFNLIRIHMGSKTIEKAIDFAKESKHPWLILGGLLILGGIGYAGYTLIKSAGEKNTHKAKSEQNIKVYKKKRDIDLEYKKKKYELQCKIRKQESEEKAAKESESSKEVLNEDMELEQPSFESFNDAVQEGESYDWLVGNLITTGSINFIYGPKNSGKTPLATQIADAIGCGNDLPLFVPEGAMKVNPAKQKVYLYDLELTKNQLHERNGDYFYTNLYRCSKQSFSVNSRLLNVRANVKELTEDATFILDNVRRLDDSVSTPQVGKKLYDGMKSIRDEALERGVKITFIVLGHTVKDDEFSYSSSDIAASNDFIIGFDTVCGLYPCSDDKRVLKIIYNRNGKAGEELFLTFTEKPFLSFEIDDSIGSSDLSVHDSSNESESSSHLQMLIVTEEVLQEMNRLKDEGKSLRGISDYYAESGWKISHTMIGKYLNGKKEPVQNDLNSDKSVA